MNSVNGQMEERVVAYPFSTDEHLDIVNRFTYHPPQDSQVERYEELRLEGRRLAEILLGQCPPSRERSLALTKLEETIFWANSSIARNEKLGEE